MKLDPRQRLMERGPHATAGFYEKCGFSLLSSAECLSGAFSSLFVYGVRGLLPPDKPVISHRNLPGIAKVDFGIGNSYNDLSTKIAGNKVDETDELLANGSSNLSFLLILITKEVTFAAQEGFYKKQDSQILFQRRMFESALIDIEQTSLAILPSILKTVTVEVGRAEDLYFTQRKSFYFGRTDCGKMLLPFPTVHCAIETISGMSNENLQEALDTSARNLTHEEHESTFFFGYGLTEVDPVKRFLFFYVSIEKKIDETFKVLQGRPEARAILSDLLDEEEARILWRLLRHPGRNDIQSKFVLCMNEALTHLTSEDLASFVHLHKTRTGMAHGKSRRPPSADEARSAYMLASKMLAHSFGHNDD